MSVDRKIAAMEVEGGVYISWRMLKEDSENTTYNIERKAPNEDWKKLNENPITTTDYKDETKVTDKFEYRVISQNGEASKAESLLTGEDGVFRVGKLPVKAEDTPAFAMGDLENNGRVGYVFTYITGNTVSIGAMSSTGKMLWTKNTFLPNSCGWDRSIHHVPFLCWDLDGDGRVEVAYHDGGGVWKDGEKYEKGRDGELLIIADGETGEIKRKAKWPGVCSRIMMTIGYINGIDKTPAIVVLDETYGNETITAVDGKTANTLWSVKQERAAGHNLDIADIDFDGVDEVIVGGICYNGDGSIRWEAEDFGHTDMSKPANISPDREGLEICYMVEGGNPGIYLTDKDGKTIFKEAFRHCHFGWIAKHTTAKEGLQIHAAEDARKEYGAQDAGMREKGHFPVFDKDGNTLYNLTDRQRSAYMPVQWDEGEKTVFINRKEAFIVSLNDKGEELKIADIPKDGRYGRNLLLADIMGDKRENIVTADMKTDEIIIISNTKRLVSKAYSPFEEQYYKQDRSQHGSGYYMYVAPHKLR